MKRFIALVMIFLASALFACTKKERAQEPQQSQPVAEKKVFKPGDYIDKNGRPDYAKLKENIDVLNSYINGLAGFDLSTLKSNEEKKAFWINVYNAFALKLVADNYPQKKDVFKIDGFFDLKKVNVGGGEYSLVDISSVELKLGKDTKDPRINFAITAGTKSSPKLNSDFYSAKELEKQLDKSATDFIRDKENVLVDKSNNKLLLSTIFRWFEDDFKKDSGSAVKYVSKFLDDKDSEYVKNNGDKLEVDYLNYDSSLDEK